jgi:hypothetical protein
MSGSPAASEKYGNAFDFESLAFFHQLSPAIIAFLGILKYKYKPEIIVHIYLWITLKNFAQF